MVFNSSRRFAPHSLMDRTARQKASKEIDNLNNTVHQSRLTNITECSNNRIDIFLKCT